MKRRWSSASPEETRAIGSSLATGLEPDGALLLRGELGAGKTALVQGLAAGLGIDPAEVQSPTYTVVREHDGPRGRLVHVDLYRLEPEEVERTAIEELLAGRGVKAVEWPERLPFEVDGALRLEIVVAGDGAREIVIEDSGAPSGRPGAKS